MSYLIYLVEDEDNLNRVLTSYLQNEGWQVRSFHNGEAAWARRLNGKASCAASGAMIATGPTASSTIWCAACARKCRSCGWKPCTDLATG